MYKVALGAGHRLATPGKRLPKELDPNETREWVLNDRVCDYVEENLAAYDGVEVLRVDDTNGVAEISIEERVAAANEWEADVVIAAHHNAAGRVFNGGGIVVYRDPLANDAATVSLQEEMYEALIRHTGLKGNRADPMAESALYVLRNTNAPAVLLELGFMDSTVDAPIILTDEFARQCAAAITEVIVKRGNLVPKAADDGSAWSKADRDWAVGKGLFIGTGTSYNWKNPVTREELAAILHRYDQNK